jgi:hypothetical protein
MTLKLCLFLVAEQLYKHRCLSVCLSVYLSQILHSSQLRPDWRPAVVQSNEIKCCQPGENGDQCQPKFANPTPQLLFENHTSYFLNGFFLNLTKIIYFVKTSYHTKVMKIFPLVSIRLR